MNNRSNLLLMMLLLNFCAAAGFWITVDLLRVDWKEGCLTTGNGGCSQPRFKILEHMLPMNEKVAISWPVSENFVQDSARSFVSHWTEGVPEDVSVSCQVVGVDPMYGFPRVCDQSGAQRPYAASSDHFARNRREEITVEAIGESSDERRRIVEVRGRCFNASLVVQKHTERCPWCPDPAEMTVINNELPEENAQSPLLAASSVLLGKWNNETQLLHITLFVLAFISVAVSVALSCVVVAYCRQRRSQKLRNVVVNPRHHFFPKQLIPEAEDRRYDFPWDQAAMSRPLAYGLFSNPASSGKGETATTTSPLDSGSSIGFTGSYRGLVQPPSSRIYHQIGSPNSSIVHDDSGLESV